MAAKRPKKLFYGWWILLVAFVIIAIESGTARWGLSVLVKPMTGELEWTRAELMGAVTVAGIVGALISPAFGRLVDRYGSRASVLFSCILAGVTLVLIGQVRSLWQFYFLYILGTGVSGPGLGRVSLPTTLANWFVHYRPIVFGILMAATSASGIMFPPIVQSMEGQWGWRLTWLASGLMLLIVAPLAWVVLRRQPEDMGLLPDGDRADHRRESGGTRQGSGGFRRYVTATDWTLKEAMRTPSFWFLNLGLLLTGIPALAFFLNLHPYLTDQGIPASGAAWYVSYYALSATLVGHPLWALLAQRYSAHFLLIAFALFYGIALGLFGILGTSPAVLYITLMMVGTAIVGGLQLGQQVWSDYYGRREIGSIVGVSSVFRVLPSTGSPLLAAWIRDVTGSYYLAYLIFAAICFTAAALLFFARPPQKAVAVPVPASEPAVSGGAQSQG